MFDRALSFRAIGWLVALVPSFVLAAEIPPGAPAKGTAAVGIASPSSALGLPVIEFYNTGLDNYFITANPAEAAAIDSGSAGPGWSRTGNTFESGGSAPVCRFYGSMSPGPNSHFYTIDPGECEDLKAQQASTPATQKRWNFESLDFLATPPANGACPAGTVPVYRAYNNGFARNVDSNHRITTNLTAIQQVAACGWTSEGIVMCAASGTTIGGTTLCGATVFDYGTPATYAVSGTTEVRIDDVRTGTAFRFPNGGNGTLTVTPITSIPVAGPLGGTSFRVDYTGTTAMQLLVPHTAGEVPLVWLWGDPAVSLYEPSGPAEMWMSMQSTDDTSSPAIFDLQRSGSTVNANATGIPAHLRSLSNGQGMKLLATKLDKNDGVFERMKKLAALATEHTQKIVNMLPASIQATAVAEINGRLHPKLDGFYELYSDKSYYHPFSYITGNADPYFVFVATTVGGGMLANNNTVAHEVGHYMSHVLGGDAKMHALAAQAHREHGKGTPNAGRPMLEEYAYFSDYSINYDTPSTRGSIENFFEAGTGSPTTQDWPSEEGYATSLLALLRTDNSSALRTTRSGEPEPIPLVQASLTDLWGLLAEVPLTVDALHASIVDYLTARGKLDHLAPILERSGWSYMGRGQVVTLQGNPKPFAVAQAVAKVGTTEYLAPLAPVTADKDGYFVLDRVFPGSNFIRVWPEEGARAFQDFPITVNPAEPTNVELPLGKYALPENAGTFSSTYNGSRLSGAGYTGDLAISVDGTAPLTLASEQKQWPWTITLRSPRPKGVTNTYQVCIQVLNVSDDKKFEVTGYYWGEGYRGETNKTAGGCVDLTISDSSPAFVGREAYIYFCYINIVNGEPESSCASLSGEKNVYLIADINFVAN